MDRDPKCPYYFPKEAEKQPKIQEWIGKPSSQLDKNFLKQELIKHSKVLEVAILNARDTGDEDDNDNHSIVQKKKKTSTTKSGMRSVSSPRQWRRELRSKRSNRAKPLPRSGVTLPTKSTHAAKTEKNRKIDDYSEDYQDD